MEPQLPADLPADPLLEVITRCDDVETVVRCAAVSKPFRRAILDPAGFRRHLGLRAAANGGFDPDLLVATSYRLRAHNIDSDPFSVQQTGRRLRFDTDLLRSFEPASSSRDGLLVLRRIHEGLRIQRVDDIELLVCNTITGHATSIPRMDLRDPSGHIRSEIYPPVLLSTDGSGRSFELFVMYKGWAPPPCREIQIFSSQEAVWGASRQIQLPDDDVELVGATSTAPAVIGRCIHWLAWNDIAFPAFRNGDIFVLALHADEGVQATVIKLSQELLASIGRSLSCGGPISIAHNLILATTTREEGKRLSVVVAEKLVISVWTLEPEEEGSPSRSWSRQEVIQRTEIGRQLTAVLDAYQPIRFDAFGERSGTVLFWVEGVGLVQLNLGTKKAIVLWKGSGVVDYLTSKAVVHEVDLVSMLQCMKHF